MRILIDIAIRRANKTIRRNQKNESKERRKAIKAYKKSLNQAPRNQTPAGGNALIEIVKGLRKTLKPKPITPRRRGNFIP